MYITSDESVLRSITITNAIGVVLKEVILNDKPLASRASVAMRDFAAGVYIITINNGKNIYMKKIIKK